MPEAHPGRKRNDEERQFIEHMRRSAGGWSIEEGGDTRAEERRSGYEHQKGAKHRAAVGVMTGIALAVRGQNLRRVSIDHVVRMHPANVLLVSANAGYHVRPFPA